MAVGSKVSAASRKAKELAAARKKKLADDIKMFGTGVPSSFGDEIKLAVDLMKNSKFGSADRKLGKNVGTKAIAKDERRKRQATKRKAKAALKPVIESKVKKQAQLKQQAARAKLRDKIIIQKALDNDAAKALPRVPKKKKPVATKKPSAKKSISMQTPPCGRQHGKKPVTVKQSARARSHCRKAPPGKP